MTDNSTQNLVSAKIDHLYRDHAGIWKVVAFFDHPGHRPHHQNWSGKYVIVQEYGNFKNPMRMILAEDFDHLFTLAWEPMKQCAFCGHMRMAPCTKRQTCPNLTDYRLETDEPADAKECA